MVERSSNTRLRQTVAARAHYCCEYCKSQQRFSADPFSVEHIIPRSKGGKSHVSNLGFSCQGCNNHKYTFTEARDPVSGERVSVFHPRRQEWNEHFVWNRDYSLIIGITPTGRATVAQLKLNQPGIVNLRRVLYTIGEHPVVFED